MRINCAHVSSTSPNDDVKAVYLYDGSMGEQLLSISPPSDSYWSPSIAVLPNDNFVIGSEFIYIYNGTTGEKLVTIQSPDSESVYFGSDVEITPDGNIFASNEIWETGQSLAHLLDGKTGELLLAIDNPNPDLDLSESISSYAATTDGKLIVSIPYAYTYDDSRFDGAVCF
jgi:outer membrane protein assembly factor BamB